MAANFNNLGAIASRMNEIETAIVYYNAALEIRRQIEYHEGIAKTLYNLVQLGINNPSVCHSEALNLVFGSERFRAKDTQIWGVQNHVFLPRCSR